MFTSISTIIFFALMINGSYQKMKHSKMDQENPTPVFKGFPGNKPLLRIVLDTAKDLDLGDEESRNRFGTCFEEIEDLAEVTGNECIFDKAMNYTIFKFINAVYPGLTMEHHRDALEHYSEIVECGAAADFPMNFHLLYRLDSSVFERMRTETYGKIMEGEGDALPLEMDHWRLVVGVHRHHFGKLFSRDTNTIGCGRCKGRF